MLGGQNMYDAIQTSQGKNPMTVCYLGTIAPDPAGNWWTNLVTAGGDEGTHVTLLQGTQGAWDDWRTIATCNPLVRINPLLKRTLLRERDAARRDPRLKARFCSYRLNLPTADETTVLLTVDEWDAVIARPVPEVVDGDRPYVGVDIGSERAWSSAVALYRNGLVVARAVAPGVPSLEAQEQRDLVPAGTYRALAAAGSLAVDEGRQVVTVERLIETVLSWRPSMITCDRFKLGAVLDAVRGRCRVEPRVTRWSSASEDIRGLRRAALDGPLAVEVKSQWVVDRLARRRRGQVRRSRLYPTCERRHPQSSAGRCRRGAHPCRWSGESSPGPSSTAALRDRQVDEKAETTAASDLQAMAQGAEVRIHARRLPLP